MRTVQNCKATEFVQFKMVKILNYVLYEFYLHRKEFLNFNVHIDPWGSH